MKIKLEKKNNDKFLFLMGDDSKVTGIYLNKEDLLKIKSNIDQMLEYGPQSTGEDL